MQKLAKNAQELFGIRLSGSQLSALSIYERELMLWNEKIPLSMAQFTLLDIHRF